MLVAGGTPIVAGTDLADASPLRMPQYYASQGLPMVDHFAAYAELYKAQTWVFVLVNKLSTASTRIPLQVFRHVSDTDRELAEDTPYGQLIANPNPRLGALGFRRWVRSTRELYGEAMALKLRDDTGRVRELAPMHPANMLVRRNEETGDLEYAYMAYTRGATALASFPASEVIHWHGYNPENTVRGLSPCEPLRQTLLAEDAMRRAQSALWRNGARPSVVLSTDKTLSAGAIERLRSQWNDLHQGVDDWAKTAILEEGTKPTILQLNAEELQYVGGRQLNRDECCAVWDVPPPAVQILDRATFSNIVEQMRSLYRETMAPRYDEDEAVLATQLAPDFDPSGELYAAHDLSGVLRGSPEQEAAADAQRIQTGQATPAEVRAKNHLPFLEGSDQLLVNAALVPLKVVEQVAMPTGDQVSVAPQRLKGLSRQDARTVTGRMSRTATVDDLDELALPALLHGLESDTGTVRALIRAARVRGASVAELRGWIAASVDQDDPEEGAA